MSSDDAPALSVVDTDGETIEFDIVNGKLKIFVDGECMCEAVSTLSCSTVDGTIFQNGAEAMFTLCEEEREAKTSELRALAETAGVEWKDTDVSAPPLIPAEVEAVLGMTENQLSASMTGIRILWSRLLNVYPSEEAAVRAVTRNSALVLPYLNRPAYIDGSWAVLLQLMSEEEAQEVITKNPGVLACNPIGLKQSNAGDIKRAAAVVDVVESLPLAARYAIPAVLSLATVALVGSSAVEQYQG